MLTHQNIVHIHPTRLCNFKCVHCYSSSGPAKHSILKLEDILGATETLFEKGYRQISLSGGEPSILPYFGELCFELQAQGYRTSAISNGWSVEPLQECLRDGTLDFVSFSFDGPPELHDKIRLKRGSFARAQKNFRHLIAQGFPVGVVVAVTNMSLAHLPELMGRLCRLSPNLIQLHPVVSTGRAAADQVLNMAELEEEALLRLILITNLYQRQWPDVTIHCDAVLGRRLQDVPAVQKDRLISPLVIDEQGAYVPFAYGMNPEFNLGNIGEGVPNVVANDALKALCSSTLNLCGRKVAADYYANLVAQSHVSVRCSGKAAKA